jgi:hypothetical protein
VPDGSVRAGKERRLKLKKIVILKEPFTDSQHGYLLKKRLRMLFPECEIETRENPHLYKLDEEIYTNAANYHRHIKKEK